MKTLIWKGICTPMFIAALFPIWPKCPSIDEWIKKMCYTHTHTHTGTHTRILLSHKKEWNPAICHKRDGSRVYYAKWNKSDRERHIPSDFIYMWNLKNKTKEQTKQRQTHRYREQMGGRQRGGEWGVGWQKWRGLRVQTSSYEISKSRGSSVRHREYSR